MGTETVVRSIYETVVARICEKATIEVCERSPINGIVGRLNHLRANLGNESIVQIDLEMTLYWQGLVQKFLVILALYSGYHQHSSAKFVFKWARCFAEHLKNLTQWVIYISVLSALIVLS